MRNLHFGTRCVLAAVGALPLTLLACGSSATSTVVDSGVDSASPVADAGKDSGTVKDSGAVKDGASVKDTGAAKDTGAVTDTGTATDAGVTDSSSPTDAVGLPDVAIPTGCGNGTVDPGEQCDDGNNFDLDGCDSHCNYEVVTRMTDLSISGSAGPAFCVHGGNALGSKAIASIAIGQLNTPLQTDVTNGTVNVFTQFLGLTDLSGQNATGFELGVSDGKLDPAKGTWPTAGNPIDWWFLEDPTTVSAGLPTGILSGAVTASGALTAGPSTVDLALNLGGSAANLQMRDAKIAATISATTDAPAPPPTMTESGLVVFETLSATATGLGLCGDITVQSLAQIPIPQVLTTGSTSCSEGYTYCGASMPVSATCNSLLDVLVGGCKIDGLITAVNATQPDVPPTGGTSVTSLTAGAGKKVAVPTAVESEAYSAYLQFAANRAHFTGEYCTATSDCQTGQTCPAGGGTCTPQ